MKVAFWQSLAEHSPLGILTDLDGALLPIESSPDSAKPEMQALVDALSALPVVALAVVSSRPRGKLEELFPAPRTAVLFAEHAAFRRDDGGWHPTLSLQDRNLEPLATALRSLLFKHPAAALECKTWSVALHFLEVPAHRRSGLLVQASAIIEPWLASHAAFESLLGASVLEVRPRVARKSVAVAWMKEHLGTGSRLLIVGNDATDEDMFGAASERDATIVVSSEADPKTRARWRLRSTDAVHTLYRDIVAIRRKRLARPSARPMRVAAKVTEERFETLIVSNRLPDLRSAGTTPDEKQKNVGGLVSALRPVLEARKGVWLGWSSHVRADTSDAGASEVMSSAYVDANEAFASSAVRLVNPEGSIWVHDYHLFLLGKLVRERGHRGRIGFFQHIPFPAPDIFLLLPWARAADVALVTPLRDGMNLVAKEFVAAQDIERPGVLLLSRFAGAAEELTDAVLTNSWDPEGTATDLNRALRMNMPERRQRNDALLATVRKTSALTWANDFLAALAGAEP